MQPTRQLTLFSSFLDSDRRLIATAIVASVISGACSALLVGFIGRQFVSTEPFGIASIVLFLFLLTLSIVTTLFASTVLIEASSSHNYTMRMTLCRQILSTGYERVEQIGKHRLIAMLSEDMNDIAVAYTNIPTLITNTTRVLFCIFYLLWIAPVSISVTLAACIPVVFVQVYLYRRARVRLRALLPIRDQRYQLYSTLTNGLKELVLDKQARIHFVTDHLDKNAQHFRQAIQRSFMASQYAANCGQSAYFVIVFALLIAASRGLVTTETVAAVALVGLFIRSSLNSLLQAIPLWMKASVAVDKMNRLMLSEERSELFDGSHARKHCDPVGDVVLRLKDVRYTYRSERPSEYTTIGPLNLEFRSGEVVFVTGGNGSGKTTLMKLITAMYEPDSGAITLNDISLTQESSEWYRDHVQAVYSDFCLIEGGQGLYKKDSVDHEFVGLLERLQLPASLADNPGQFESLELSSGQRARMALLPIFLNDKPIVMFDEWAAHQDPEFKDVFYNQILAELKLRNKLIIAITHDDRYFDVADRIIDFESGKVVTPEASDVKSA